MSVENCLNFLFMIRSVHDFCSNISEKGQNLFFFLELVKTHQQVNAKFLCMSKTAFAQTPKSKNKTTLIAQPHQW